MSNGYKLDARNVIYDLELDEGTKSGVYLEKLCSIELETDCNHVMLQNEDSNYFYSMSKNQFGQLVEALQKIHSRMKGEKI